MSVPQNWEIEKGSENFGIAGLRGYLVSIQVFWAFFTANGGA